MSRFLIISIFFFAFSNESHADGLLRRIFPKKSKEVPAIESPKSSERQNATPPIPSSQGQHKSVPLVNGNPYFSIDEEARSKEFAKKEFDVNRKEEIRKICWEIVVSNSSQCFNRDKIKALFDEQFNKFYEMFPNYNPQGFVYISKEQGNAKPQSLRAYSINSSRMGKPTFEAIVSTGIPWKAESPPGLYKIEYMNEKHSSSDPRWSGAPMNYYINFHCGRGIGCHATTPSHYPELGCKDSGGCVRMHNEAAKSLFKIANDNWGRKALIFVAPDGTEKASDCKWDPSRFSAESLRQAEEWKNMNQQRDAATQGAPLRAVPIEE